MERKIKITTLVEIGLNDQVSFILFPCKGPNNNIPELVKNNKLMIFGDASTGIALSKMTSNIA